MTERFPNWHDIYQEREVDSMPWFFEELDPDLKQELNKLKLNRGTFLDIGTGPGTQAEQLSRIGFDVTGTDLSEGAVEKAKARFKGLPIRFVQDDILATKLSGPFDYAFDRGCFHVLAPEQRQLYVDTVAKLLPKGRLFLKCFSVEQPDGGVGPWRFDRASIESIFKGRFKLDSLHSTVYQGTLNPLPKALFCSLVTGK